MGLPTRDRPGDRLDQLAAGYWDTWLETNPTFATSVGDPRFDALLPDPTPAGTAASRVRFAALLDQLTAIDPGLLEPGPAVTHAVLRASLEGDLAQLDTGLEAWNVDPLDGLPVSLLQLADYQRPSTPAAGATMVERWRAMSDHIDRHVASLRGGLAAGQVACIAPVDRVIDILASLLGQPDPDWPLLAVPLAAIADLPAWDEVTRGRFAVDLGTAVTNGIRPAFARMHDALTREIRPVARPVERPGLCHVRGGDEAYRHLARVHTSLEIDPDDLHRTGLAEIERIDGELDALAARTLGTVGLADALAALRADPALYFSSRDEVFTKAIASLSRAEEAIPAWFGRLPRARCEVVPVGAYEEEHSTIAFYRQPAEDGSRPGQYYVNTAHPETRPRYEAEVLAYHEAIPGHHLQIAIGQELADMPAFRRHLGPTAFFEGWGLYSERLADEMGLYSGDLDRIGVLSFDAWRAARLVVDTGMHAKGWTRDEALEFMLGHTALAANNIANEVDRYISMPGQALAYKTGQLEILRLRDAAHRALGPAFDIRAFHDTVLGNGALPLATLRGLVEAWVSERTAHDG